MTSAFPRGPVTREWISCRFGANRRAPHLKSRNLAAHITPWEWCQTTVHLTRFGGHLILAEGRRKESRYGTSVEVPG